MSFITKNGKITALLTMNEIMQMLPPHLFIRIHKSFIVSLKNIEIIEKARVIIHKKNDSNRNYVSGEFFKNY